jgi:acetyl esterase/lipase
MKRLTILTLLLAMSTTVFSQIIHLWPGEVPGAVEEKHEPVQTPDTTKGVIRLTDVSDPTLQVFAPEPGHSNGTGIVVCPGGGYQILAINLEGYEIGKWLSSLGYTAFVLQYRVPNLQFGALQDVQRAIRIVRSHAAEWKLDAAKTGVLGFSAGGSLSARAATLYNTASYPKADKADELSCKPAFAVLIYPAYLDMGEKHALTPELKVDANTPPMFLFATADDSYSNSALVMAGALREAKVPVELHLYAHGGHGYGLRAGNPAGEAWPPLAEKWLKGLAH